MAKKSLIIGAERFRQKEDIGPILATGNNIVAEVTKFADVKYKESTLEVPESCLEPENVIVAVGPDVKADVQVGDYVYYRQGATYVINDITYVSCKEEELCFVRR